MNFFISDTYFDDYNIARRRHYKDAVEMNNIIVSNWNSIITDTDNVYILGGFGSFNFFHALVGRKTLIMSSNELKEYEKYISSITDKTDSPYNREMFEVWMSTNYGVVFVNFNGKLIKRDYIGRDIRLTTNYTEEDSIGYTCIVGTIGDYQRMFKKHSNIVINSDVYVNGMYPLSELEVEGLIQDARLY